MRRSAETKHQKWGLLGEIESIVFTIINIFINVVLSIYCCVLYSVIVLKGPYCSNLINRCVFSVCQVPVAEGKSVQQTVDILHKKLEQLGAVKQGSFCVDCETYHATATVSGNVDISCIA